MLATNLTNDWATPVNERQVVAKERATTHFTKARTQATNTAATTLSYSSHTQVWKI